MFGGAAILIGAVGIAFGQLAGVWQPTPDMAERWSWFPYAIAAGFLIGGTLVQWPRTQAVGGFVLAALFGLFAVLWIKRILLLPLAFGTWGGFAEELSLVVAALLLALRSEWREPWRRRPALDVLRVTYGICAIAFGFNHFFNMPQTSGMVPAWIPPGQHFWALATGIADVAAGLAIITLLLAPLAARLLTLMFASYSVFIWLPALFKTPAEHFPWAANAVNLALIAAAWVVGDALTARRASSPR